MIRHHFNNSPRDIVTMECIESRTMEKEIASEEEMFEIFRSQKLLTIAMCSEGEPYLATLDFGLDEEERCLYFHTSDKGKKVGILKKNRMVHGQVHEDLGFVPDACDHAFRLVQFKGRVDFLFDQDEIKEGLRRLREHQGISDRTYDPTLPEGTLMGRIRILEMNGIVNRG